MTTAIFAAKLYIKIKMKQFKLISLSLLAAVAVSCSDDDPEVITVTETVTETVVETVVETVTVEAEDFIIDEDITEDTTLTNDQIWTLSGRVFVKNGATLTIEAGTLIKAVGGTGTNASVLVVAQGASIQANGTADAPIIMTSAADNIELGQIASDNPNLGANDRGLWGGLIVLGYATVHGDNPAGASTQQIEGIPADVVEGLYGGDDDADSSGSITYLSIRHGGALIGEGNEINGLTLGGVGTGTTIDNVEVIGNIDDGIEFFGGSVNATNLLVWGQGDDAIDLDQSYDGTIENVMVILEGASDHAFEIDGPKAGPEVNEPFTVSDITVIGSPDNSKNDIADFRDGANGSVNNLLAYNLGAGTDVELNGPADKTRFDAGELVLTNWEIVLDGDATIDGIFDEKAGTDPDSTIGTFNTGFATAIESAAAATVGADASAFSWTFYTSQQ